MIPKAFAADEGGFKAGLDGLPRSVPAKHSLHAAIWLAGYDEGAERREAVEAKQQKAA